MAKVRFKSYNTNETVLFPSSLGERIPGDHPVRLLSRIEQAMDWDIRYMWLSGNQHPSFSSQIGLDVQYIDGTKIESSANRYTFVWRKTTERNKARLEEKIRGELAYEPE